MIIYFVYLIPLIYLAIIYFTRNLRPVTIKERQIKIHWFAFMVLLPILLILLTIPSQIDKVAFSIGNLDIRWYALWIMLGVLYALYFASIECKKEGVSVDALITGVIIILPISLVGARIWYYLFNMDKFANFFEIFSFKDGWAGIAIQGGIGTAVICMIVFALIKKISIWKIFDIVAPTFLIGQIFGRLGNFSNHELYGSAVQNLTAFHHLFPSFIRDNMYITGGDLLPGLTEGTYHPMFLYEMLLNGIGLSVIIILRKYYKYLRSGDMIGYYMITYGFSRSITESLRLEGEVLMWGDIRVSLVVAIISMVIGAGFIIFKTFYKKIPLYRDIIQEVKQTKIDTVLFDLDGTLIDSKELVYKTFIEVFAKFYPEKELTDEELDSFYGPTLKETFSKFETEEEKINELIESYREINSKLEEEYLGIFKGVKDILRFLKKENYKVGIVSSKKGDFVKRALERTKITKFFNVVISEDEVEKPKPDPEGILKAIKELDGKNVLYVGDSTTDIEAAKKAKIKAVAINHYKDERREADLLLMNPDYYIRRIYDITKII